MRMDRMVLMEGQSQGMSLMHNRNIFMVPKDFFI